MDALAIVRAALDAGARTRREITAATGLDAGLVDAIVDVLVRTGDLDVHRLKTECGIGGCGNCHQGDHCTPGPVTVRIGRAR